MTAKEHLLVAEAHLLMADCQIAPNSPDEKMSPHLHLGMFHLEAALAIAEGKEPKLPEPELLNAL